MSTFEIVNGILTEYNGKAKKLKIPEGVTRIGKWAFHFCESIQHVEIPQGVTRIDEEAFSFCENLQSIIIPEGVISIGDQAFNHCESLRSIVIPESVTSVGKGSFSGCKSLVVVTLPEGQVCFGKGIFSGCRGLKLITTASSGISEENIESAEMAEVHLDLEYYMNIDIDIPHALYIDGQLATELNIPVGITEIGERAFHCCTELERVIIPEGIRRIGAFAFDGCCKLRNVVLPESLIRINEWAFAGCRTLQDIDIPKNVTIIEDRAFQWCAKLQSMVIPQKMTSISNFMFSDCVELKTIFLPESITSIGDYAFSRCKMLNITIPDSVTQIGSGAFRGCEAMKSFHIPETVTSIGNCAFEECTALESIIIPETVSSIGHSSFRNCKALQSIVIPSSVADIGDYAFLGCENLSSIVTEIKLTPKMFYERKTVKPIFANDCGRLPHILKPDAAVGFAENPDDLKSVRGKSHIKYIKANTEKLVDLALEYMSLLKLMLDNKLLTPEVTDTYLNKAQEQSLVEAISMLLDYQQNKLTSEEKQKATDKAEAREEKITEFVFGTENMEQLRGKVFVVTGKLKTFSSRDEFKACLDACGAVLSETLNEQTNYLITNTPDSGSAKNKKAEQFGVKKITEDEFNQLIGRVQA